MAIIAGIDEAGLGPILGPLAVSAVCFEVDDGQADLWKELSPVISKNKKRGAGKIYIADSKKVYSRQAGIGPLARGVLSFFNCLDGVHPDGVSSSAALLERLCPDSSVRLTGYPWYADVKTMKPPGGSAEIAIASAALNSAMYRAGIKLLDIRTQCLDVGHYNKMIEAVGNKSSVLFTSVCTLIERIFSLSPEGQNIHVFIDRNGGRTRYVALLRKMFPSAGLKVIAEDSTASSYELVRGEKKMTLRFEVKADDRRMPVALASMVSKYVRELFILALNEYFLGKCGEIKPTAGYWQDGKRFIEEIKQRRVYKSSYEKILIRIK